MLLSEILRNLKINFHEWPIMSFLVNKLSPIEPEIVKIVFFVLRYK